MQAVHISLPSSEQRRLVFYLAMEEYVAQHLEQLLPVGENGAREAFFLWQVPPTVIFGRNQVMEAEVNLDYCKAHHIHLFRRKSGGGCVYSDMGNIMLSYISDNTDVTSSFDIFLQKVTDLLAGLGLDSRRSGRNDVLIGTRKVSGNSLFLLPCASIVHGTLLYHTDFEEMAHAITPSTAKISSKGVVSVRQHVTNVKEELEALEGKSAQAEALSQNLEEFKSYIIRCFCGQDAPAGAAGNDDVGGSALREWQLDEADVRKIEEIEATYLDPDFLKGRKHAYSLEFSGRIEQVGEVKLEIKMDSDYIEQCWLRGDIFPLKDQQDEALTARLAGCPLDKAEVEKALAGMPLEEYVLNLRVPDLLALLFPGQ